MDMLLVVEAGLKGGAQVTARIALDYGVPVYAVPGDVDRVASVGTNLLIRDGRSRSSTPTFSPRYSACSNRRTHLGGDCCLRRVAARSGGTPMSVDVARSGSAGRLDFRSRLKISV
jgi:predicted Rossmann fold nucleotide-binding protein DprA/Smf involved in DNA uptake